MTSLWLQPCADDEEDLPSLRGSAFTLWLSDGAVASQKSCLLFDLPAGLVTSPCQVSEGTSGQQRMTRCCHCPLNQLSKMLKE